MWRTYSDLIQYPTLLDRFKYLKLDGIVGIDTFGHDRFLNQALYTSYEWKKIRNRVIVRDMGCDMALDGYGIYGRVIIHHINPLSIEDIESRSSKVFDMDNLVCVSHMTHEAIHYGDESLLPKDPIERKPGDTRLW